MRMWLAVTVGPTKRPNNMAYKDKTRQAMKTLWHGMLARCYKPSHNRYKYYGARGISVCPRWLESFDDFWADMGTRPAGLSLDRVDNNGNYEPGNCRWATAKEQIANRSLVKKAPVVRRPRSEIPQTKSLHLPPNKTGFSGVQWKKDRQRWRARIRIDGREVMLGSFKTAEEAHAAYMAAREKHHGYPANGKDGRFCVGGPPLQSPRVTGREQNLDQQR